MFVGCVAFRAEVIQKREYASRDPEVRKKHPA